MDWKNKKLLKEYKEHISDELYKDLSKDMTRCSADYSRHKMIASIIQTMRNIDELVGYDDVTTYAVEDRHELTEDEAIAWVSNMVITGDDSGKKGEHWTLEQTTSVAEQYGVKFEHIRPIDWWVTMNEIYTDNYMTLQSNGITDIEVYVGLAKDFLFDTDAVSPKQKLHCYYKYIVKK